MASALSIGARILLVLTLAACADRESGSVPDPNPDPGRTHVPDPDPGPVPDPDPVVVPVPDPDPVVVPVPDPDPVVVHYLVVSKQKDLSWSLDPVAIAKEMTTVLEQVDTPGDVAVKVRFEVLGDIGEFDESDGIVLDHEDFEPELPAAGAGDSGRPVTHVRIVERILCCGCQGSGICVPGIVGCAGKASTILVVAQPVLDRCWVRQPDGGETYVGKERLHARLWLHEFGHTRGILEHREHARAVMHPFPSCSSDSVDQVEATGFRTILEPADVDETLVCPDGEAADHAAMAAQGLDRVEHLVDRVFVHGVPFGAAERLERGAADQLVAILLDRNQADRWANAALLLGLVADESAVPILAQMVEDKAGSGRPVEYHARANALVALGFLLHRTDSDEAYAFLRERIDPAFWTTRPSWFPERVKDHGFYLAAESVLSFALSIRDVGAELDAVKELKPEVDARLLELLESAKRLNDGVRRQTLREYFRGK